MTDFFFLRRCRPLLALLAATLLLAPAAAAQAPAWRWGLQTTNPTPADGTGAEAADVTTDAAGRVTVGGRVYEGNNGPAAVPVRSFGSVSSGVAGVSGFVAQATAAGQWAWVQAVVALPGTGATPLCNVTSVAAAPGGDVYAVGRAEGAAVQTGGQTASFRSAVGGLFVARFSSAGVCQWVRTVEGYFGRPVLAYDPSTGGVVVAGAYSGRPVLGGVVLPPTGPAPAEGLVLARLSPAGQWLTTTTAASTDGFTFGLDIAVGTNGQVGLVTSLRVGTTTFGPHVRTLPVGTDAVYAAAQLSPTNQWQWVASGNSNGPNGPISTAWGAAYTASGALWVSGRGTNGTVVGPVVLSAPSSSTSDGAAGFLGQLSPLGVWGTVQALNPTTPGLGVFGPLAVDAADNLVVLAALRGYAAAPVQALLGTQTISAAADELTLFVASLRPGGTWNYVSILPAPTDPDGLNPFAVALASGGSLYLAGALSGRLVLGSSILRGSASGSGASRSGWGDVVLGRLDNAGPLATAANSLIPRLTLSPNPARSTATLTLPAAAQARAVTVADALGRMVLKTTLPAQATALTLDVAGLAPGVYTVRCAAATARLVVE